MSLPAVSHLSVVVILLTIGPTAGSGCVDEAQVSGEMEAWMDEVPEDGTLVVRWSLFNVSLLCLLETFSP